MKIQKRKSQYQEHGDICKVLYVSYKKQKRKHLSWVSTHGVDPACQKFM